MLGRFWRQENKSYRNMQLALTLLTLNFLFPSLSYFFTPDLAIESFRKLGAILGGMDYPQGLEQGHVWRVLASGNVFTLAFCCFLLQLDVKRFAPIIPVFTVLKSWSALGYLYVFLFQLPYRLFAAVFLFDGLAVFLVLFFGLRALRAIEAGGPEGRDRLVPRLRFS